MNKTYYRYVLKKPLLLTSPARLKLAVGTGLHLLVCDPAYSGYSENTDGSEQNSQPDACTHTYPSIFVNCISKTVLKNNTFSVRNDQSLRIRC